VFVLSASNNLIAPSLSISLPVLSENEMKCHVLLQQRFSNMRDEFDSSASDNSIAPLTPRLFPVLSENEMKQQVSYL
jgi:hypothetical protein